jgi:hypothetical protein
VNQEAGTKMTTGLAPTLRPVPGLLPLVYSSFQTDNCEAAQPTKQSMFIIVLRSSGLLPAAFLAVAMTMNL